MIDIEEMIYSKNYSPIFIAKSFFQLYFLMISKELLMKSRLCQTNKRLKRHSEGTLTADLRRFNTDISSLKIRQ